MKRRDRLTRGMAVLGALLVWFPVLAPVVLTGIFLATEGIFRFDFLMPAELGLVALAGCGLLLWAAIRARWHWLLLAAGIGLALVMVVGSQALAVATGLASGALAPGGWQSTVVLVGIALYDLLLAAVGLFGILLVGALFADGGSTPGATQDPLWT